MNNNSSPEHDSRFLALAIILVGCLVISKYEAAAYGLWAVHQGQILVGVGGLSICALGYVFHSLRTWHKEHTYRRTITAFDPDAVLLGSDENGTPIH